MVRVTKHPEVRRNELLDVAFDLIQRVGFEQVSVETITTNAGVAKGTFYHYFDSKDDLLYQLVERFGSGLTEHLARAVADSPGSARERLQALVDEATAYKTAHTGQQVWLSFLYRKENQVLRARLYTAWAQATRLVLRPVVEQGVADGSFSVIDLDTAVDAVLTLWYEGADRLWLRAIAEPDADSFARVLVAGGAGLKQAQERVLGMPDGTLEFSVDRRLEDAVKPLYYQAREVVS